MADEEVKEQAQEPQSEGQSEGQTDDYDIVDPDAGEDAPPKFTSDVSGEDSDSAEPSKGQSDEKAQDDSAFPKELVDIAKEMGLDDDDVKSFKTPDKLANVLRKALGIGPGQQGNTTTQLQAQPPPQPKRFELNLDENWEPEVRKVLTEMHQHYEGELADSKSKIDIIVSAMQEQEAVQFMQWFDSQFESLQEYEEVFGKGPTSGLDPGSKEFLARKKLADGMDVVRNGFRTRNPQFAMSLPEIWKRAMAMEFADNLEQNVRRKIGDSLKSRDRNALSRPTTRNGRPLDARRSAIAAVTAFMRERGSERGPEESFE